MIFFDLTEKWQNQNVDRKKWESQFPKVIKRFTDYTSDFNLILNSSPVISSKKSALYFAYPYLDDKNRSQARATIDLRELLNKDRIGPLTIRFHTDAGINDITNKIVFDIVDHQELKVGDITKLNYNRDSLLKISIKSSFTRAKSQDLFFSAKSATTGKSVSLPIRFIEKVPKTHGQSLVCHTYMFYYYFSLTQYFIVFSHLSFYLLKLISILRPGEFNFSGAYS